MPWRSLTTLDPALPQSVLRASGERAGAWLLAGAGAGWLALAAASAAAVAAP